MSFLKQRYTHQLPHVHLSTTICYNQPYQSPLSYWPDQIPPTDFADEHCQLCYLLSQAYLTVQFPGNGPHLPHQLKSSLFPLQSLPPFQIQRPYRLSTVRSPSHPFRNTCRTPHRTRTPSLF
ncbi:hypothetical protein CFOL_v3_04002 [Cephalotus follicularis]|uniref:Uncharacterized protein n=1 Tax=Cephalotus follicularis TaxID=3775 RepID=A0A1Q3AY26_CEPFO|nr:hypothetical protein CFOL_v3_04002 [Cephalotus follicularis]